MQDNTLRERHEQYRVEIRNRQRKERMSKMRAENMKNIQLTPEDITNLRKKVTVDNVKQYLQPLRFLSLNDKALDLFIDLVDPLMLLAADTKGYLSPNQDEYQFACCLDILCNMVFCSKFTYKEDVAFLLYGSMKLPLKQQNIFDLYTNLFNYGASNLVKKLIDNKMLDNLDERKDKTFQSEETLISFTNFVASCLTYADQISVEHIDRLTSIIKKCMDMLMPEMYEFQLCLALSRSSGKLQTENMVRIIRALKSFFTQIFMKKKAKPISALQPMLHFLSIKENAYKIFEEEGLFDLFKSALETRLPHTKQLLITVLANMAGTEETNKHPLYLNIYKGIEKFEQEKPQIQMALGFLMAAAISRSQNIDILKAFNDFGLANHLKILLESRQNIESINTGLLLLQKCLQLCRQYRVKLYQTGIMTSLERLNDIKNEQIFNRVDAILNQYFRQ